jgi:hypothetical protein
MAEGAPDHAGKRIGVSRQLELGGSVGPDHVNGSPNGHSDREAVRHRKWRRGQRPRTMHGTVARLISFSAMTRPWPAIISPLEAIISPLESTKTG